MGVEMRGYERVEFRLKNLAKYGDELDRHLLRFTYMTSAIAKKETPVDTGRLRASIFANLRGKGQAEVGTNLHYAVFVELGHNPVILPVRAKALRFYIRGVGWLFRKRVEQGRAGQKSASWVKEGSVIKKPFLKPALEWARKNIVEFFRRCLSL